MKKIYIACVAILTTLVLAVLLATSLSLSPAIAQGGVTGFANIRVTNFYRAQPRTTIVITNGSTLNVTGSFQRISSTVAMGTSGGAITIKPAGTMLTLLNVGAQTITFTETGILKSAGNIALGTLDAATLFSDGTNWYQVSGSNN